MNRTQISPCRFGEHDLQDLEKMGFLQAENCQYHYIIIIIAVHRIDSTGSSLSRAVSERVTGPVSGSESRRKRRIGKHALTHSAGVSRGGMQAKGHVVSAYQNRRLLPRARPLNGLRRIVTIRTASEGITLYS